jgi:hypothetical protein
MNKKPSNGRDNNSLPLKKDTEVNVSGPYDEYFVPVNEHRKFMRYLSFSDYSTKIRKNLYNAGRTQMQKKKCCKLLCHHCIQFNQPAQSLIFSISIIWWYNQ